MARFFVGQRVRLVRPIFQSNMGKTGRIAEIYPHEKYTIYGPVNCAVDWDDGGRGARFSETSGLATHTEQLEPIQPSGHQPSEYATVRDLMDAMKQANPDEVVA